MEYQLIPNLSDDCFLVPSVSDPRRSLINDQFYRPKYKGMPDCSGKSTQAIKKVASEWDKNGQIIWKSTKGFYQQWDDAGNLIVEFKKRKDRRFYVSES